MSSPQLVYIDASVLGYALLPHPSKNQSCVTKARAFFNDINIGKYLGIISTITELEFLGVAKRLITKAVNRPITKQEEQTAMNDLKQYTQQLGIGLDDSDVLSIDNLGNPNLVSGATIVIERSVPYFYQKRFEWKQMGGTDALTVNLAIRLNAQLLATFDRGFYGLRSSSIRPLIVQDAY